MINRKSESIKLLESIQTNLKESITIDEIEEITQRIESAEDMDEIQQIIYTISDGVLEDEVQNMFDSCNEDDDLDEVKSLVLTTLEDNAEYDESSLKESKELKESDESILKLAKKSIVNGKLPEEIEYKGKTYKQFYVTNSDNSGETSDIYYCNMENTPSGDPQESNDYFYLKVALNKTENGYKGIKEIKFAEDLTESKSLEGTLTESVNIGDKVKILNSNELHNNKQGEVTYIDDDIITVKLDNGRSFNYDKNQVQKIEEGVKEKLNESYDMYNVIEDSTIEIRNLKEKIDKGEVKDIKEVSRLLGIILRNIEENISDAW